jgi:hypothetical protein
MSLLPDFYLASTEDHDLEEPRECYRIRRLRNRSGDQLLLMRIHPPLDGAGYGVEESSIERVVVAPRLKGSSLFPITKWPVHVYLMAISDANRESVTGTDTDEMKIISWAELYETREDAVHKKM